MGKGVISSHSVRHTGVMKGCWEDGYGTKGGDRAVYGLPKWEQRRAVTATRWPWPARGRGDGEVEVVIYMAKQETLEVYYFLSTRTLAEAYGSRAGSLECGASFESRGRLARSPSLRTVTKAPGTRHTLSW